MRIQLRQFLWSGLAVLLMTLPAAAKLEITNIKAVHGPLGPERADQAKIELFPGEELYFRYTVAGAATDDKGNINGKLRVKLFDPDGKVQLDQPSAVKGLLALGGGVFPGTARLSFAPNVAPGKYKIVVEVSDSIRKESASFEREVTVKPTAFAVINPRIFYDKDGKIPAPPGGHVNQFLFFRMQLIGFDTTEKKIQTNMTLQFLDKSGRELMPRPLTAAVSSDNPEEVQKALVLNFNGTVSLNRAGEFTMRVVFADRISKKEVKFETTLKVEE